jgi:drug/metabolite transporter (DMT)-like permease
LLKSTARSRRLPSHRGVGGILACRWHDVRNYVNVVESNRPPHVPARMSRGAAVVALHVSVALFAFAALFGKWIALPATAIVLGRTAIAAATLAVVASARGERAAGPEIAYAWNGLLLALHWVTFFAAIQIASVAVGLLGYASFPVFVLLLERTRRATSREYSTALLAAGGLVALVPDFSWSSNALRGLTLGLVSGFTFAWLAVRNRRLVADRSATRIALWQNVFAAGCLLPIVAVVERASAWPGVVEIALLLVLGVVCTGLAHTLFIASLRNVSAHAASVVAALEPVYGIALAAWLLREIPDGRTVVGGVLIVVAALLATRRIE